MKYRYAKGFEIDGHLDIIVSENVAELDREKGIWKEILIHGDSAGLRSHAKQFI